MPAWRFWRPCWSRGQRKRVTKFASSAPRRCIRSRPAHVGVIPGIKEFIAEFTSDKAWGPDGYLADKGLIALPEAEREKWRKIALDLANNVGM